MITFSCIEGVNLTNWSQEWIGPQVRRIEQVIETSKFGPKRVTISLRYVSNSDSKFFNINLKNGKTNLALSSTFKVSTTVYYLSNFNESQDRFFSQEIISFLYWLIMSPYSLSLGILIILCLEDLSNLKLSIVYNVMEQSETILYLL